MDWPTRLKLGLALAAGIILAGSVWTGQDWLRWVAIALLFGALGLRFLYRGRRRGGDSDDVRE